jgi:von Willebrand factor type A domain
MSTRLRALAVLLLISCDHQWSDGYGGGREYGGARCDDPRGVHTPPSYGPGAGGSSYGNGGTGGGTASGSVGGAFGSGTDGGASMPASTGYCSSDSMCGSGSVCDRALGACAQPRGGCGTAAFQPTRTTGEMVLLVDRSNSMRDPTPSGTKWTDLTGSIASVLSRRSEVAWGLSLFPASDKLACVVSSIGVTPAVGTAASISSMIQGASPTGSGTPTRAAVQQVGGEILGAGRSTRKYVLLATDGEPNCSPGSVGSAQNLTDINGAAQAVRALAEAGASTFVLGVAVRSDAAAALAALAQAGGHARQGMTPYYTAGDAAELETALDEVARQIALCTFELSPPPPAGSALSLSIGGQAFSRNVTHVGDGWDVTGAGRAIELYGAACDAIQGGGSIQISYGCGAGTMCDATAMACVPAGVP